MKNGTAASSMSKSVSTNKPVTSASLAMNNGASRVPVSASGAPAGKPVPQKKNMFGWNKTASTTTEPPVAAPEKPNDENVAPTSAVPPPPPSSAARAPDMSHALQEKSVQHTVPQPEPVEQYPIEK